MTYAIQASPFVNAMIDFCNEKTFELVHVKFPWQCPINSWKSFNKLLYGIMWALLMPHLYTERRMLIKTYFLKGKPTSTHKFQEADVLPKSTNAASESENEHDSSNDDDSESRVKRSIIKEVLVGCLDQPCVESNGHSQTTHQLRKEKRYGS